MEYQFELLEQTRHNFSTLIHHFDIEQLNKTPEGFSNNLAWNFGHILVTQQLLCYRMSNLECQISEEMINRYRKGSKPMTSVSKKEIDEIDDLLESTYKQLVLDYNNGLFEQYNDYPTSYNVTLSSIEDAIQFNILHEALHFGYAMALKNSL